MLFLSRKFLPFLLLLAFGFGTVKGQTNFIMKFKRSEVYSGIEVGSKGVKMSVLEVAKNAQQTNSFNTLKDSAINTDIISFTASTFTATLDALTFLYLRSRNEYKISPENIFTVFSSGVVVQAEKAGKIDFIKTLADSFKIRINEPGRQVPLVDVTEEARLSHLGIVPAAKRFNTFLIDIGSGNTKGGYFPNGNTTDIRLFDVSWGTKSVTNSAEKRLGEDISLANFQRQLYRVLEGAANNEIVYAVNLSNGYNMNDNIAFSGGIAWSVATLIAPELMDNPVVPVTYDDVEKFYHRLYENFSAYHEKVLSAKVETADEKSAVEREVSRVHKVFDQRSLLAGTGLLLRIMRQFEGIAERKQFYLVKNGQVGWISAYVDQHISK